MRTRTTIASALIATSLVITSCGGGGSDDDKPKATTTTTAVGGVPTTSAPDPVKTNEVSISDFAFSPSVIQVKAGSKITITNDDSTTHTFTSDDGSFDTGDIEPGDSATVTVKKAGTVGFHCEIHISMTGSVVVTK